MISGSKATTDQGHGCIFSPDALPLDAERNGTKLGRTSLSTGVPLQSGAKMQPWPFRVGLAPLPDASDPMCMITVMVKVR